MGTFATGKKAYAISDRSGMRFPYREMVREWNGFLVHYSEYEAKQPQLDPKPVGSDPQALRNPRVQQADTPQLILLTPNPFESIIYSGVTYVNVYSQDHQRSTGNVVRLRGNAQVITAGSGGAFTPNLQQFANIPTFDNVSDLNNANGFTITDWKNSIRWNCYYYRWWINYTWKIISLLLVQVMLQAEILKVVVLVVQRDR
jgi:hypothetical protein